MNKTRSIFCLVIIFHFSYMLHAQVNGASIFQTNILHEIRINFDQEFYWDSLVNNYEENIGNDISYLMADIIIDDVAVDSVGVRFKGFTSYIPEINKKPLKIDFNEFVPGKRFDGLRKLNLHIAFADPSMQRDVLAYYLMRSMGVPAPRTSYSKVYINDQFWGVYQNIEQIDRTFLDFHFENDRGNLFKNEAWSYLEWEGEDPDVYQPPFELKTNEEQDDWSGFINLLDLLNNTSSEDFVEQFPKVFDVAQFLKTIAVDVAINNWDSYLFFGRNYYLYEDTVTSIFHWLPWDYNLSFGAGGYSVVGGPCNIQSDFVGFTDGTDTVEFYDLGEYLTDVQYVWKFGDGNSSNEKDPVHIYTEPGVYEVCFEIIENDTCIDQRCRSIDTQFDVTQCPSNSNGTFNGPIDFAYQKIIDGRPSCCDFWVGLCEVRYEELQDELDGPEKITFEADQSMNEGILINRLLAVDSFQRMYQENLCELLNYYFVEDRLFPIIDANKSLISEAVYQDTNFLYTINQFENDLGEIDNELSLKYYIKDRIKVLKEDLGSIYECPTNEDSLAFLDISINEFLASNNEESGIVDQDGEADDWVELYNNTNQSISLDGFALTDHIDLPKKWEFPDGISLNPGEYLIVWTDNDEDQEGLHTNFRLDKEGEYIGLTSPFGSIIDSIRFGAQNQNISFSRIPNGIGDFEFSEPTPGYNNESSNVNNPLSDLEIRTYPVPADRSLVIELKNWTFKDLHFNMTDVNGRRILSERINSERYELNIDEIPRGIYFLQIVDSSGRIFTKKIIK